MRSAIAFAQVIDHSADKVSSKDFAINFPKITAAFQEAGRVVGADIPEFIIEAQHIDGSMSGNAREERLNFLKEAANSPAHAADGETEEARDKTKSDKTQKENTRSVCRVLSNVRCLSKGVDVPALDAVLFLSGKNSQVEITQAVGRVMRTAKGKKLGYIILPVVIPEGQTEAEFLHDSKVWQTTWQVVQALRSHDASIDNSIARAAAGDFGGKIEIVDMRNLVSGSAAESAGAKRELKRNPQGRHIVGSKDESHGPQGELPFQPTELMRGIFAKLADRCGTRLYWANWAARFGKTAGNLKLRIKEMLTSFEPQFVPAQKVFAALEQALRDNISAVINKEEALNILVAQAIAQPIFSALFAAGEHDFPANNAVAKSLSEALNEILSFMEAERENLQALYKDIRRQLGENPSDAFRQTLIKDIYQNTIKAVYGEKAAKTVVYTPIEAVDFILRSVADVLEAEFGSSFDDENIKVLEPFAGTGSFIARLLSGRSLPRQETGSAADRAEQENRGAEQAKRFISPAALPQFCAKRVWLNEINLLAYYAAIANVETTYHRETGNWQSFKNACLTDTFILNRAAPDFHDQMGLLAENRENLQRQEQAKINVILGNPPYDRSETRAYAGLDERIEKTYVALSKIANKNPLYDGYIRAFRWASDRIDQSGSGGIIAFITGNGFIEKSAMDGMRKCFAEEYSSLYIINLRGDIRKNMLSGGAAQEGDNIFGQGSMTGIAISILVKNPQATRHRQIFYHKIGNNLTKQEKLDFLVEKSLNALPFTLLTPDKYGDWLNKRDNSFRQFIPLGDKKDKSRKVLFNNYSLGVATHRDSWAYNFSETKLAENMQSLVIFYNQCAEKKAPIVDATQIKWASPLIRDCENGKKINFQEAVIVPNLYRPFTRSYLYYGRPFCEVTYQMPQIFPNFGGQIADNLVISVSGIGARSGFSVLISNILTDLGTVEAAQNFPLYLYIQQPDGSYARKEAITEAGLRYFHEAYSESAANIEREDIFYYIYGLLHSPAYCEKYKNNLMKELPRIPCVQNFADFRAFAAAGCSLAALHLNFDKFDGKSALDLAYAAGVKLDLPQQTNSVIYKVRKMRFGGRQGAKDKSIIYYNAFITVKNIPLAAYDYMINGKSAIDWVVDRQKVKTDKVSGIINDPNLYAQEQGDPAYSLKLLLSVISLSLKTRDLIANLPALELRTAQAKENEDVRQ